MSAGKIIGYIAAGIFIFFGVIFVWGAFGTGSPTGWLVVGLIGIVVGFGIIWFVARQKPQAAGGESVTLNIDLPANVNLDSLKCKSCGGVLSADNIKMVAGAPVVTCPYCGTVYQLTEEPKW